MRVERIRRKYCIEKPVVNAHEVKCKVSYGAGNKQRTRTQSVKWIIVTSVVSLALEKMRSSGKLLLLALTFKPYQRVYGI